jgi:hypothetical protein
MFALISNAFEHTCDNDAANVTEKAANVTEKHVLRNHLLYYRFQNMLLTFQRVSARGVTSNVISALLLVCAEIGVDVRGMT